VALARDPHGLNDIGGVSAPGDSGWMTVDQTVPSPFVRDRRRDGVDR
jgi:hypothetical protein